MGGHAGEQIGKKIGVYRKCINHGQLNPVKNYPDSFCGQTFNSL